MNFKTFLLILSVFAIISCGDDGSPTLEITSPENGATYFPGDAFTIVATFTDDVGLASVRAESELFAEPFNETYSDNRLSDTFELTITLSAATPVGEYDILLTVTDTDSNTDTETLTISVE